jgi:methyl-accepting chemotaxis protein
MKIKIKLSIMMIAIVMIIAGGLAVIELERASSIALDLAKQKTMYLARQRAQYWDGRINGYLEVLQTAANVFGHYEDTPAEQRRDLYGKIMRSIFDSQDDFVRMFTVWKPDALDGMDSFYIGRPGTTPEGQIAFALTREFGDVQVITALVVQQVMDHITGPDARTISLSDPAIINMAGKDTYCIRIIVPIINSRPNEVVGGVGCQLDIAMIQPTVEQTIKNFDEVSALSIYTNDGYILGSYVPERIGKMMKDVDTLYDTYLNDAFEAVKAGKEYECFSYSSVLETNLQIAIANIPLGSSKTTWSVMVGST